MASLYTCRACSKLASVPAPAVNPRPSRLQSCLPSQTRRTYAAVPRPPPPKSSPTKPDLAKPKTPGTPKSPIKPSNISAAFAEKLRSKAPILTETYVAYGAAEQLFKECSRPGDYTIPQALEKGGVIPVDKDGVHLGVGKGWWYETLGLQPNFNNWTQITFLHLYLLQVRIRMFPSSHAPTWIQQLTNHTFYAAEDRLAVYHHFTQNSLRQKYLKEMFSAWRGALLAYDEGLMKGDAVLAAAVWRNLMSANPDTDFRKLAQVVAYLRRELRRLEQATDDEVAVGNWKFGADPGVEKVELVELAGREKA